MPAPHEAEAVQDIGHPQCHGGFTGAGIAGERHVQGRWIVGDAELCSDALDKQQRGDLPDARLDGRKADQFAIELFKDSFNADRFVLSAQINYVHRGGPSLVGGMLEVIVEHRKPRKEEGSVVAATTEQGVQSGVTAGRQVVTDRDRTWNFRNIAALRASAPHRHAWCSGRCGRHFPAGRDGSRALPSDD